MGIGNKQIGWSQESNLLWEINKQLDKLIKVSGPSVAPVIVTKAQIDALIAANNLTVGRFYLILDADVSCYGGTSIMVQAITTNQLSREGHGLFYNPKYDRNSKWLGMWYDAIEVDMSGRSGSFANGESVTANNGATGRFVGNPTGAGYVLPASGNWAAAVSLIGEDNNGTLDDDYWTKPTFAIDAVVYWGGFAWKNLTGAVGSKVDDYELDATNWEKLPFDDTYFNVVYDPCLYQYDKDFICGRADEWGNEVKSSWESAKYLYDYYGWFHPVKCFKWGYGQDYGGDIQGWSGTRVTDSAFVNVNWYKVVYTFANTLEANSAIYNNPFVMDIQFYANKLTISSIDSNTLTSGGVINNNTLTNGGYINGNNTVTGNIANNTIMGGGISNNTLTSGVISNNTLTGGYIINNTLRSGGGITNNTLTGYINGNTLNGGGIYNNTIANAALSTSTSAFVLSGTISQCDIMDVDTSSIDFTAATIILNTDVSKYLFKRLDGTARMRYVNDSDAWVITTINA